MNIVLTGPIGSGKSAVARRVMARLGWRQPAGFFTRPDSERRPASALLLESWSGVARPFARRTETAPEGTPPYETDLKAFDDFAVEVLRKASERDPVVVDELGVLELKATRFTEAVVSLFRRAGPLLAVIQQRALDPWIAIIGRHQVDHLFVLDAGNRDALPDRITALFETEVEPG